MNGPALPRTELLHTHTIKTYRLSKVKLIMTAQAKLEENKVILPDFPSIAAWAVGCDRDILEIYLEHLLL